MSFTKTFPYNTGTFVIIANNRHPEMNGRLGTIGCYSCVTEDDGIDDEFTIWVAGYQEAWSMECFLDDIRLATDDEVAAYKDKIGIKED